MIRILNAEPAGYSNEAFTILRELGEVRLGPVNRTELLRLVADFEVLIVRLGHQIDAEVLSTGRNLRAIVTATTGLDHIDLAAAEARGIRVLSLRGETEFLESIPATAEHTWALLLGLVRRLPAAHRSVLAGQWDREAFKGRELRGKRLGLAGLGRVGRQVVKLGLAFGMTVVAYDPYAGPCDGVRRVERFHELLADSDVLSLHAALTRPTHGMIGESELQTLPAGAVVINTARGELIDEQALAEALESGRLAGAALDTLCHERQPELRRTSPLLEYARRHDNLIVTPHLGGATQESMARTEVFMARKLGRFLGAEVATI